MAKSGDIRERIEARISQGEFLASMLFVAGKQSEEVQDSFVANLSKIATSVRELLENNNLLEKLPYRPASYWPSVKGKTFAFIDGGVANIDLPSAAPIGIRVGSYIVRPGDESERRERFNIELQLVDDLYSASGFLYDDDFLDIAKLRDAARMVSEVAAAYRLAALSGDEQLDAVVLHGPLINPVAPYGLEDFPAFSVSACRKLLNDETWNGEERERQFVSIYLEVLERLRSTGTPVVGAVERSIGRDPVFTRRILDRLQKSKVLKEKDAKKLEDAIIAYGLNDASLLDVVLAEDEYVTPIPVMRQGPENKWPEEWKRKIREYPDALTTYIKPSALVMPFRVEAFEGISDFASVLELILHTSRLLPSYGFPVGLDIVDKFAKVPSWMSRSVKGQHQVVLLKKALESGDPRTVAFAKRVLAARGRDWLFRPSV
ncbi:DNA double-strand break repair nuclease NurA [Microvirga sp. 3-52]|uniref:DNA double-strand break repair nuclease NurA n=1 Tax=Microvirga sp. 3-52 TaxID=2792425 RepID=UPI001AC53CA0|nr:DNA double-strand break repair nuclease NurA [Microvirga sp. 3-52]MBO1904025.1 DNA double-strand break repair nuclease NurA [Microvirga sp. 3-52]MBS7451636.1 DNA double-strand break repair nuclease NurA [Microvirga sp. 3-52]